VFSGLAIPKSKIHRAAQTRRRAIPTISGDGGLRAEDATEQ